MRASLYKPTAENAMTMTVYGMPKVPKFRKKVIVGGTRDFDDYRLLAKTMDRLTEKFTDVLVLSGGQSTFVRRVVKGKPAGGFVGADALGERWASSKLYGILVFHADKDADGKNADAVRNQEMVDFCGPEGFAAFFWDGKSPGTKDCIARCRKKGVRLKIVRY